MIRPAHTTHILSSLLIVSLVATTISCKSREGGTALGAVGGALLGGAVGYAVGGEKGAIIGAGAGAVAGGVAGYSLSQPKIKQVATEKQVQDTAAQNGAPILEPVLEMRDLSVTPQYPAPGQSVTLDMGLRAVSGTEQQLTPPAVNVSVTRDGKVLREQQLAAETTGDVQMQSVFAIPDMAEAGIYNVAVSTVPQGNLQASTKEATFEVKEAAPAAASGN